MSLCTALNIYTRHDIILVSWSWPDSLCFHQSLLRVALCKVDRPMRMKILIEKHVRITTLTESPSRQPDYEKILSTTFEVFTRRDRSADPLKSWSCILMLRTVHILHNTMQLIRITGLATLTGSGPRCQVGPRSARMLRLLLGPEPILRAQNVLRI